MDRAGSVSSVSSGSYSDSGSSYGYSSASSPSAASSVEVVRVRPRAFHVPSLTAAAPRATPLERIVWSALSALSSPLWSSAWAVLR